MGDPVSDWIHQPIPEKLWHYTSTQGFQGIISSGYIYATDVRFLNDREEFVHARKIANNLIAESPELGENQFPFRESLQSAVDAAFGADHLDPNRAQILVASFSVSEDDLSQWRGYSHGTSGVSIAFDLRFLRPPVESGTAATFAPCVYEDSEKKALILSSLQHFVEVSKSKWSEITESFLGQCVPGKPKPDLKEISQFTSAAFGDTDFKVQLESALKKTRWDLLRIAGLLKHRAFQHEREWRFVLPIAPGKDKTKLANPIRFRSSSTSIVPYLEFQLAAAFLRNGRNADAIPLLPVNDLILGPGSGEDSVNGALALLQSKSIKAIPRKSDVPYRAV
jgi:hypothetical protein